MDQLDRIAEHIRADFDARTAARDTALTHARTLTRYCANAIRSVHRNERDEAQEGLKNAGQLVEALQKNVSEHPDIYFEGYTQDALKEYAEAFIVFRLTHHEPLPQPEELGLEYATYLKGMAEAVGELRRRSLDLLRQSRSEEAEQMLSYMDDIFAVLTSMDYPDGITGGLRRLTDLARGIIERTRGDLTITLRQEKLEQSMHKLENYLNTRTE